MSEYELLLRADASNKSGSGHVMRCLALAQAWDDAAIELIASELTGDLAERATDTGITVHTIDVDSGSAADAQALADAVRERDFPIVVLDGYNFDAAYQRRIAAEDCTLVVLDDFGHADHYYADIVLNQGLYADESLYSSHEPETTFLFGPEYVLLRDEFRERGNYEPTIPERAANILVTMGGTDPDDVTTRCVRALNAVEEPLDVRVVLGPLNEHHDSVSTATRESPHDIEILQDVRDMSEHMIWAHLAVAAAGTTVWELAHLGVPSQIVEIADNQRSATILDEYGLANWLGSVDDVSEEDIATGVRELCHDRQSRRRMSERGRALVDGRGAERVRSAILDKN